MTYHRILVTLILTTFTDSLAEEFLQPLIVLRLEQQGVSTFLIGLASSAGDLGVLLAAPLVPGLARSLGAVAYLRRSLLAVGLGILLFPLFPNVWVWIALDFALGAITCGYFVLSDSLVNAAVADAYRGRALAAYMIAESLGAVLGPTLLGGVGIAGVRPFVVAAAIMAVGIVPWFLLGGVAAPDLGRERQTPLRALARGAPLVLFVALAGAFFDDVPASLLPLFALERGLSETAAVLFLSVLAAGTVLLQFPAGWGADRFDRRSYLVGLGLATAALSVALLFLVGDPWLRWPTIFLLGGLFNAFDLVALALLGERARLSDLASLSAAMTMAGSVASFLGPPVAGAAMDVAGADALPVVTALVAGGVAAAGLWDRLRRPRVRDST